MKLTIERSYGSDYIHASEGFTLDDLRRISAARVSFPSLEATVAFLFPQAEVTK